MHCVVESHQKHSVRVVPVVHEVSEEHKLSSLHQVATVPCERMVPVLHSVPVALGVSCVDRVTGVVQVP